jgi:transcription antitermination protein NusB
METQALQPQKFRELVLQVLFSHDVHASDSQELCVLLSIELKVTKRHVKDALAKVEAIVNSLPEIDAVILEYSTSYAIDRIQSVERAILRLGLYELLLEKTVPYPVIVAEAKRLAKKFATPDAAVFCQALLDGVYKGKCSS